MRLLEAILLYFPTVFVKKLHKKVIFEQLDMKSCYLIPDLLAI